MRDSSKVFVMAVSLLAASTVAGQEAPASRFAGSADFGVRLTDVSGDEARYQRFRDMSDGAYLDRFRLQKAGASWAFDLRADHIAREDQFLQGRYRRKNLKLVLEWDQVPLFISRDTQTLYQADSPGVLRINDAIQQGIQSAQFTLASVADQAAFFETRSRRDSGRLELLYRPTRDLDMTLRVKTSKREGTLPWGASFGFNNDVEVAAPQDTRTTDVAAGIEWANERGMLRLGYDGSWFDNHVPTLVWDNPLRLSDSATAPGQGRSALWPSSTMHSVTTAGSIKLPANSRFTGNVTVGTMSQDEPLLPFTINSAIAPIPLPRPTADAEVRTLAMTHTLTSRPTQYVWLSARYRYYDFDNRTPPFLTSRFVGLDSGISTLPTGGSEPISSTRQNLDLDASFTPIPFTALKVGYGHDSTDRTHRIFASTNENVFRASVDSTKSGVFTVRGIFEHSSRKGSGFEEEDLIEIGEQPAMRHFDIANRDRNRFTALVQVTPVPQVGLTATAMRGKDDYADSGLGLRDSETRGYTVAVDFAPRDAVAGGLSYAYDKYTALQNSRQANPGAQFTDPTRDWSVDLGDRTETVSANLDLLKLLPQTDLRLGYEWNRARATYVYGAPADSTLLAVQQLPPLKNELQIARAGLTYFAKTNIAVRIGYGYERYRVEDFSLSPSTIKRIDLPGSLFLGYVYRPYTAHTGWLGVSYLW